MFHVRDGIVRLIAQPDSRPGRGERRPDLRGGRPWAGRRRHERRRGPAGPVRCLLRRGDRVQHRSTCGAPARRPPTSRRSRLRPGTRSSRDLLDAARRGRTARRQGLRRTRSSARWPGTSSSSGTRGCGTSCRRSGRPASARRCGRCPRSAGPGSRGWRGTGCQTARGRWSSRGGSGRPRGPRRTSCPRRPTPRGCCGGRSAPTRRARRRPATDPGRYHPSSTAIHEKCDGKGDAR